MKDVASASKTTRPTLRDAIVRHRLIESLDAAWVNPVIWISAPAGAGKTTLAAQYLDRCETPVLWYRLDTSDDDIANVVHHLELGLRQLRRGKPIKVTPFTPEYLADPIPYFRRLFSELFDQLPESTTLVFDDYHEISEHALLHRALAATVELMPAASRLLILSRSASPPAFSRLGLHGGMSHLDWADLQLTFEESQLFFDASNHTGLAAEQRHQLYACVDGWIAGLRLLLETPNAVSIATSLDREIIPQEVFDYFASEVFDAAPPAIQQVLLASAFLKEMDAASLEQLTGNSSSAEILKDLYRRNFFVSRFGQASYRYRYHPLFREFLLERAARDLDADALRAVRERAVALSLEQQEWDHALTLLEQLNDLESLRRLFESHAPDLVARGAYATLKTWAAKLSDKIRSDSPWVMYWLGVAHSGVPAESRGFFEQSYARFKELNDARGAYLAWSAAVRTVLYQWDDCRSLDGWIAEGEILARRFGPCPTHEVEAEFVGSMIGAFAYRNPAAAEARVWEQRAHHALGQLDNPVARITLALQILFHYIWYGTLRKAKFLIEDLEADLQKSMPTPVVALYFRWMKSMYLRYVGELKQCRAVLDDIDRIVEETGVHSLDFNLAGARIYLALVFDDRQLAEKILETSRAQVPAGSRLQLWHYHFICSVVAARRGDLAEARASSSRAIELSELLGTPHAIARTWAHAAYLALMENDVDEARRCITLSRACKSGPHMEHFCDVLEAAMAFRLGHDAEGLEHLRRGLRGAKENNIVAYILWIPEDISLLYARALNEGIEVSWVRDAIRRCEVRGGRFALACKDWPWQIAIRCLGEFSVEIDGKPLDFAGRVQRKPLDLLKALTVLGGRNVPIADLIDVIWEDSEGDSAEDTFSKTLRRLRALLNDPDAILVKDRRVTLNPNLVWVDTLALDHLLKQDTAPAPSDLVNLYRGDLLPDDRNVPWTSDARQRTRKRIVDRMLHWARILSREQRFDEATRLLESALSIDATREDVYVELRRS